MTAGSLFAHCVRRPAAKTIDRNVVRVRWYFASRRLVAPCVHARAHNNAIRCTWPVSHASSTLRSLVELDFLVCSEICSCTPARVERISVLEFQCVSVASLSTLFLAEPAHPTRPLAHKAAKAAHNVKHTGVGEMNKSDKT